MRNTTERETRQAALEYVEHAIECETRHGRDTSAQYYRDYLADLDTADAREALRVHAGIRVS